MAGFFTASFILDKIPFANFLNAPIMYGATCVQGFVYIKILTALNSSSGTDVDTVIRNVISENAVLIKKLLSEFFGSSNQQTHKAVSIYTLETRRTEKANKTKKEAISNVKYMLVAAILGVIGVWYCSTNEAYTRDVTDLWITSFTSTSWNVWWYLWGGIMLISTLIFFGTLTGACFGYAEYFKIKSTPLSSFAEKNEYLSDNQSLETLVKKELGCKRWNKVITILSHLLIGMVAGLLTYLFYIYCIGHSSSEMITVKYAFMDARSEEDTHYVWYIMAGSGILSAVLGLYNIYMFFKSFFK